MWGETIRTAPYLVNRSSTSSLKTTPVKNGAWKDLTCQDYTYLEMKYMLTRPIIKLEGRGEKYIFIDYRLWNKNTRKITLSRDVKFVKNIDLTDEHRTSLNFENLFNMSKPVELNWASSKLIIYLL